MHTLNNFQKLLGDINWLRPFLRFTTGQLQPFFQILQGDSNPSSSRHLTSAAIQALKLVENAIQHAQVLRLDPRAPVSVVCTTSPTPTSVLWQPLGPLEWIHLSNSPS